MTLVDIDDLECEHCGKITTGILNMKTKIYTCNVCDKEQ